MPFRRSVDRREFLRIAGATLAASPILGAREQPNDGMIVRGATPLNLEFPFATLDSRIIPNDRFFVRNHFAVPKIDLTNWRLKVDGLVNREFEITYDELRAMPAVTLTATIECAGNGRSRLVPKVRGVPWDLGAVSTAEWTRTPLAGVLERAGVRNGAVDVVLEGADRGEVAQDPKSPGAIAFERSLPLAKATRPEVLLAYKMNGAELSPDHGYPLRVVVPGWYGMASVKWLKRISVIDAPFRGYWQTSDYSYWQRDGGRPIMVPVSEMQVKASIARPTGNESLASATRYRIFGAAWAGESDVARVEVSRDGGETWRPAKLIGEPLPFTWRLWEYEWQVPNRAGAATLMARATDQRGRTQPAKHDPDRRGYMINFTSPTEVVVR